MIEIDINFLQTYPVNGVAILDVDNTPSDNSIDGLTIAFTGTAINTIPYQVLKQVEHFILIIKGDRIVFKVKDRLELQDHFFFTPVSKVFHTTGYVTGDEILVIPEPAVNFPFYINDYNVLENNVEIVEKSKKFVNILETQDQQSIENIIQLTQTPNLDRSLLNNFTSDLSDSQFLSTSWKNSRYDGAKNSNNTSNLLEKDPYYWLNFFTGAIFETSAPSGSIFRMADTSKVLQRIYYRKTKNLAGSTEASSVQLLPPEFSRTEESSITCEGSLCSDTLFNNVIVQLVGPDNTLRLATTDITVNVEFNSLDGKTFLSTIFIQPIIIPNGQSSGSLEYIAETYRCEPGDNRDTPFECIGTFIQPIRILNTEVIPGQLTPGISSQIGPTPSEIITVNETGFFVDVPASKNVRKLSNRKVFNIDNRSIFEVNSEGIVIDIVVDRT